MLNDLYQLYPASEDHELKDKLLKLGLKITADHEECTFKWTDFKLKTYMPLIYQSSKGNNGNQPVFKNVNKDFVIPEPSNKDSD